MSERFIMDTAEPQFVPEFKNYVKAHLLEGAESGERLGQWWINSDEQILPISMVEFKTEYLEAFDDDLTEVLTEKGEPKQFMSVDFGGGHYRSVDERWRLIKYFGLTFYERSELQKFGFSYGEADDNPVSFRVVKGIIERLTKFEEAGKMKPVGGSK